MGDQYRPTQSPRVGRDAAFEAFYLQTCNEEIKPIKKRYNELWENHPRLFRSRTDILSEHMTYVYGEYDDLTQAIAPMLHDNIKQYGKPIIYHGTYPFVLSFYVRESDAVDFENDLPFMATNVLFPYHYCAHMFPYSACQFQYIEDPKRDNSVIALCAPKMPSFKPPWRDDYDPSFSPIHQQVQQRQNRLEKLNKEVENAWEYSGKLFTGFFVGLWRFFLALCKMILKMLIPSAVFALFFFELLRHSKACIPSLILYGLYGLVFLIVLCVEIMFEGTFSFLTDFFMRCRLRGPIPAEIARLKQEISELQDSNDFKEASRRNQKLYEDDCQLAWEWQSEWYEQFVCRDNSCSASGESAEYENER